METVAENIVDAIVSPLFYALIGGAPLAMAYRAVNTLDSMVGYKMKSICISAGPLLVWMIGRTGFRRGLPPCCSLRVHGS